MGKALHKFGKSTEAISELEGKSKRQLLLLGIGIIVGFITLMYLCADNYHKTDGGKMLIVFFVIIFGIASIISYRTIAKIGVIVTNLAKNELEIKTTHISGVYTENPHIAGGEKYFKISYDQIEKIECESFNFTLENFHNFIIYHSGGLIKLAIDLPMKAKDVIYDMLGENRAVGQVSQRWKCTKCEKEIVHGQASCENCGQVFDWSKV